MRATDASYLPVLPHFGGVLLPGETRLIAGLADLSAREQRLACEGRLDVAVIPAVSVGGKTRIESYGVLARVRRVRRLPNGEPGAEVVAGRRVRVAAVSGQAGRAGSLRARCVTMADEEKGARSSTSSPRSARCAAAIAALRLALSDLAGNRPLANGARRQIVSTSGVARLMAAAPALLTLTPGERMVLASEPGVEVRVKLLLKAVAREKRNLRLSEEIRDKAAADLEADERRAFLHEQMRVIQRELGRDEGRDDLGPASPELDELAQALSGIVLPDAVRAAVDREMERMALMPPGSPEYMVSHTYVSLIRDLPWGDARPAAPSLARARRILGEHHFGLAPVKERVLEYLAVLRRKGMASGEVLLLSGPPGVGKSTLACQIAEALGRPFVTVSLGGVRDEAEIRGHRRTYVGSMPGKILAAIKQAKSRAPVILLDEIDKVGLDHGRMSVANALLEALDPGQNHEFVDHYLGVPYDLSSVIFVATANGIDGLPAPLLDRMELVEVPSYTEAEKREIAARHLVPRAASDLGLPELALDDRTVTAIIRQYTREAGVRQLQRSIKAIGRKLVLRDQVARRGRYGEARRREAKGRKQGLTPDDLPRLLGPVRYLEEPADARLAPGVALGLAYTSIGGEILYIESALSPSADGRGRLTHTGSLGKVMKESAQAAWAYVLGLAHARPEVLQIDSRLLQQSQIHLHLPCGAVPKDGPSAGLAIVCALVSLLTGRALSATLAMTGEISLRGQVLPIGGLKEKLLAAHRHGKRRVLIPAMNLADLAEVPKEVLRDVEALPVTTIEEALRLAGLTMPALAASVRVEGGRAGRMTRAAVASGRTHDLR